MTTSARPDDNGARVARIGIGFAAVVVAAQVSAHLFDFWALNLRSALLDSASEHGIFVRLGSLAILACAVATLAHRRSSRLAVPLAVVAAWLFADALLGLHAHLHGRLVNVPLLAAIAAGYWLLAARFAPAPRRLVHAALALLVLSAAIHVLGPPALAALGWGQGAWEYQVKIALKEATEIAGWILLASGLLATRRRHAAYR
ncbi:MAG TPA: hypothetical protein VGO39_08335 [Gaiellaceae bacterium]|jgi:hypothetical protein|nr:hypothetical protein [Gaiellaceae bacterium]